MKRRLSGFVAVSFVLGGCASQPVAEDTTPLNTTAVIERHMVSNGIKGFFPFETNEMDYVRANMRRDEHDFKGTGTFSSFIVGSHSGTSIARIDRKLLWTLNPDKEQYTECPLRGCQKPVQPAAQSGQQQPEAAHEKGCVMRLASHDFSLKPTGEKRNINGFDAEQYQGMWTVVFRDNQSRTTTSNLLFDIWTTPVTPNMRDALNLEAAYYKAYLGTMQDADMVIPEEANKLIASYLAKSLSASDQSIFLSIGKQLQKVKGYPISTQLTWNMGGNACTASEPAAKKPEKKSGSMSVPTSAGGLASGLANMFVQKKVDEATDQAEKEPILKFSFEVRQLKTEPRRDSLFTVPGNYTLVKP